MQPPEGSRIKIAIAGEFRRTLAIFYLVWCFVDCLVSFAPIETMPVPKSKYCSSVDMTWRMVTATTVPCVGLSKLGQIALLQLANGMNLKK